MQTGQTYQHSFTVSEPVYEGFINVFNDRNLLHTDAEFAVEKGFKGRVMHGNILNGFISYFVGECLPLKNVIIHAQSIKFSLPVYLGDELKFNAEITGVYESVHTYEFKFYFKNKEGKKVAKGEIQIGLLP
jgi:3-hydroxybutyryl-CoA dehydratase